MDSVTNHFHNWFGLVLFAVVYGVFIAFIPFYRKSQRKPSGAYLAFVLAFVLEMFGMPMSMYVLAWIFGHRLPDGILRGHTLNAYIGDWGMYIGAVISLSGVAPVVVGWHAIHAHHWSKEAGQGGLVTSGICRFIRNPQFAGFLLITLSMMFEWTTVTLLIMWPVLVWIYFRLARREERDMEAEFGEWFLDYRERTGMFLSRLRGRRPSAPHPTVARPRSAPLPDEYHAGPMTAHI